MPPGSPIRILNEVDVPGNRIAVASRSAYDLWLTDNIQHAELVRAPSLDESYSMFMEQQLEALAGLRPKLVEEEKKLPGFTLLEGCFTVVQQSIGCKPKNLKAAAFLKEFVQTFPRKRFCDLTHPKTWSGGATFSGLFWKHLCDRIHRRRTGREHQRRRLGSLCGEVQLKWSETVRESFQ